MHSRRFLRNYSQTVSFQEAVCNNSHVILRGMKFTTELKICNFFKRVLSENDVKNRVHGLIENSIFAILDLRQ